MTVRTITLSYEGTTLTFDQFTDGALPREVKYESSVDITAAGLVLLNGAAQASKFMWSLSPFMTKVAAENLLTLFYAWDADRAAGTLTNLVIVDGTFGSTVTRNVVFASAPKIQKVGAADTYYTAQFSVIEA